MKDESSGVWCALWNILTRETRPAKIVTIRSARARGCSLKQCRCRGRRHTPVSRKITTGVNKAGQDRGKTIQEQDVGKKH